jgi:hypothetical protein
MPGHRGIRPGRHAEQGDEQAGQGRGDGTGLPHRGVRQTTTMMTNEMA